MWVRLSDELVPRWQPDGSISNETGPPEKIMTRILASVSEYSPAMFLFLCTVDALSRK